MSKKSKIAAAKKSAIKNTTVANSQKAAAKVETPKTEEKVEEVEVEEVKKELAVKEETPTVEQPSVTKEPKKADDTIPNAITTPKQKIDKGTVDKYNASALNQLAKGDRISADKSVDLMNLIHKAYLTNPDTPEEIKKCLSQQFDVMMLRNLILWNVQTCEEFGNAGINVNTETFNAISEGLVTYFGITVKGIPSKENKDQLQLQFQTTPETVEIVKESIKDETSNVPIEYTEGMTDEEIEQSLRKILNQKNGIVNNLKNSMEFAKTAYKLKTKDPSEIISTILQKLTKPQLLLEGFGRMMYGAYTSNDGPIAAHAILKDKLKTLNYSETEIANLVRLFFVLGAKLNYEKVKTPKTTFTNYIEPWNNLTKSITDQNIIDILSAAIDDKTKTVDVPKIKDLSVDKFNCDKIVNYVKLAYGTNLNTKQLKQKMQSILSMYQKEELNPLADYIEKSIYKNEN